MRKAALASTSLVLAGFLCVAGLHAEESADTAGLLQPNFKFQHQLFSSGKSYTRDELLRSDSHVSSSLLLDTASSGYSQFNQYDATFSYPFLSRNGISFDLGINLRMVDAELKGQGIDQTGGHINTTLPMFYASALFNLPLEGMSASVGGSHMQYDEYFAFDYRAKLSYTWQNGFGLEGGWQHQRFNIDGTDVQADFEVKGPFLDLKYRF